MHREYPCPHCGWTVDSSLQPTHCPRCSQRLPSRAVELGLPGHEPAMAGTRAADWHHGRAWESWELREGREPWLSRPEGVMGLLTFLAVALAFSAVWVFLDTDQDGIASLDEWRSGTSAIDDDTDSDGLPDGWERAALLRPDRRDTDLDGVGDGTELKAGLDPLVSDSDGDGLSDGSEWGRDCDRDGIPAARETDDDDDWAPDGEEPPGNRCRADTDRDGVLDGHEGNPACATLADCDGDHLPDALETALDALDPDAMDLGSGDLAVWAMLQRGAAPTGDADRDGIPDGWETGAAMGWGPLQPDAAKPEILLSVVRIVGPDSERAAHVPIEPALARLAERLAERGVTLRHTSSVLSLAAEPDPSAGTPSLLRTGLVSSSHPGNPFVATLVLVPGASEALPPPSTRSLAQAVDLGEHLVFRFGAAGEVRLRPSHELQNVAADGSAYQRVGGTTYTWRPPYFFSHPVAAGAAQPLPLHGVELDVDGLAGAMQAALGCGAACELACLPPAPLLAFGQSSGAAAVVDAKLGVNPGCPATAVLPRTLVPTASTVHEPDPLLQSPPRPDDSLAGLAMYAGMAALAALAFAIGFAKYWARRSA